MNVMKAFTVWQPWATLIAIGAKTLETRGRRINYRGMIAIHAGKKIDREACEEPAIKAALARHGYNADNLPTGAVIAIGTLSECWSIGTDNRSGMPELYNELLVTKKVSSKEEQFGWYEPGRYAWELVNVHQLTEPIPAKGQQGLWNWEGGADVFGI